MSNDSDKEHDVSKAYRSYSKETAPADLDRAVLREAGTARTSGFWSRFYTWRRPLAFAATLVLGVTLVYDMQRVLQRSATPYLPTPEMFEDSSSRADQEESDRVAPASVREEELPADTAAGDAAAPASNDGAANKFSAPPAAAIATEQEGISLQPRRIPDRDKLEEKRNTSQLLERARSQADTASLNAATAPSSAAQDACDDARFDSAERWWRCVEQLRSAGEATRADAELRDLRQQFPDFSGPPPPD